MNGAGLQELLFQTYPADDLLLCVPTWEPTFQPSRCSPQDIPPLAALCPQFPALGLEPSGFRTSLHLYKTELCRRFAMSAGCKYGDRCQFAHGLHELRLLPRHPKYKTEYCRTFHTLGFCPYDSRCHFIHEEGERRLVPPQLDAADRRPFGGLGGGLDPWHPASPARARSPASDGVSSSSASETPELCPGSPSPSAPCSSSSSSSSASSSSRCNNDNNNGFRGIAELLLPLALKLRALEGAEPPTPAGPAPDCPSDPPAGRRLEALSSVEAAKRLPVFSRISTRNT
uniref:mRNA decay activator protein ZFP36L2-like n=1 Tax=Pristiophorus japonicus TaxID=55135 RepID=UPI00398F49AB